MTAAPLEERLRDVLAARLGDTGLAITTPQRLSGGASRQTWSFDVRLADGSELGCILRRDHDDAPASRHGSVRMVDEAALLGAAAAAGVPVPRVIASGDADAGLGAAFLVMERVAGETIPRRILRDAAFGAARGVLVAQCAAAAARIHAIPLGDTPFLRVLDPLEEYRAVLDARGEPHPAFELALRWLHAHRPAGGRRSVVHGDLRLGNLVVGEEGLRAVLDWELAHTGDPLEDLGWMCVRAWRFGAPGRVAGLAAADELIDAYRRAGGGDVDTAALRWWEVMGTLRWGVICIVQASTHLTGEVRSVELAAIGRRVCQVEWDLLTLLDGEL